MVINTNLKEIGKLFAKHRYIANGNEIQQYNTRTNQFKTVPNQEVLEIFKKIYIDFERKPITLDLLRPYLPKITSKQLETYKLCKQIKTSNLKDQIDQEIAKAVENNNKRKIDIPGKITASDYKNQVQFLINNDILTNGKSLFKYNNGAIKLIDAKEVGNIIRPYINVVKTPFDLNKLILLSLHHLTKINIDYKKKLQIDKLTKKDWQKYQEIKQLLDNYKVQ